jgi:hypothetical protein
MADLAVRRWVADPIALLVVLLPVIAWVAVGAHAAQTLPALALAGLVAALALSGST